MPKQVGKLSVLGSEIIIVKINDEDFINLIDIAKYKDPERTDYIIQNRLRNRNTIEYLGLRELIHNPNFNSIEFDGFKNNAGSNSFSMTPKRRIGTTRAIGLVAKQGRYGGTYAHKDIAIKFASWISVEFELYLIQDYQRLKQAEMKSFDWSVKRLISKVNYKIHTDAIQQTLIPKLLTAHQTSFIYADEADLLNVALFGMTAAERRQAFSDLEGNMRDHATIEQLIVLSNLESVNAELIRQHLPQSRRVELLNTSAIHQMKSLVEHRTTEKIERLDIS